MARRIDNFANVKAPENEKVLLELRHVDVKFNVRGRILNAIRDVSLKIYDGESIAIVGESGSGKSVLTKTFAGMLDSNGFISHGKIIFSDEDLAKTTLKVNKIDRFLYSQAIKSINRYSHYEPLSETFKEIESKKQKMKDIISLNDDEIKSYESNLKNIDDSLTEIFNDLAPLSKRDKNDKEQISKLKDKMYALNAEKRELIRESKKLKRSRKANGKKSDEYLKLRTEVIELTQKYNENLLKEKEKEFSQEIKNRNDVFAKEVLLSFGRYPIHKKIRYVFKYLKLFKKAAQIGKDLTDERQIDKIYAPISFRVKYISGDLDSVLYGRTIVDCAKIKYTKDWQKIRGCKIATVFQDPMTSLNPIIPIGRQIMTVILKHQRCSELEAKRRAIDMMNKVGIPDPDKRFYDYPFQYSGGMRQRIVIAIALSCQPKILICDEPTTALDVTIQAQIIRLIKQLQKDLGFTTVYITHDLGVVANVADRVAVLYAGQIVELGKTEDIFFEPAHPYTWALLSSMPQLSPRGSELFSIKGTPPSLYNKIVGDAFALRSEYAMAVDFVKEPPMYQISEHHYAKTWLLDERAPKIERPQIIQNLHAKMSAVYKTEGGNEDGK